MSLRWRVESNCCDDFDRAEITSWAKGDTDGLHFIFVTSNIVRSALLSNVNNIVHAVNVCEHEVYRPEHRGDTEVFVLFASANEGTETHFVGHIAIQLHKISPDHIAKTVPTNLTFSSLSLPLYNGTQSAHYSHFLSHKAFITYPADRNLVCRGTPTMFPNFVPK